MKRKRGHKKGKSKKSSVVAVSAKEAVVSSVDVVNVENESALDEFDDNLPSTSKYDSGMEIDTPSSTGTDQLNNLASVNPDGSIGGKGVEIEKPLGRVKVKLRTPKIMESQLTSSDAPTQSDTDKSSQQMGLERQAVVAEKMEDSANSLPEATLSAPGNSSKKAGSIKIKSSKSLGPSIKQTNDDVPTIRDESPHPKELKTPVRDHRYDKEELETCLVVIKKVMKMDAAEPFNSPVNPVALGIPDYFDVIDTPMDFGTICSNLESGVKYSNSVDVFKDVQFIWDNCYKYNNKGDYILELLKRVKKNFTKYWTAAGLYSGQPRGADDGDGSQEKAALSSQGKLHAKGGQSKKSRKGGRRHKADCLCAICVLKRRRREREENDRIAKGQIGASDNNLSQELKHEESSPAESPSGENSSSDMDESSADPNADPNATAEGEERKEGKIEESNQHSHPSTEKEEDEEEEDEDEEGDDDDDGENGVEMTNEDNVETPEQFDKLSEDGDKRSQQALGEESGDRIQSDTQKGDTTMHHKERTTDVQRQKHKGTEESHKKIKANQIKLLENPMLLDLCGVLFPDNPKSIWRGPHSLVHCQSTSRKSSIHAAIDSLMKSVNQ
ncbi:uncharacterized protein LOC133790259 [Humulus lupulus]|uniref:uncharacterized protein LOC133790259 n=1 Tax=Humulus lupulus TaxID=3486 RepID=UPI002B40679A|nr:uncharacterized protein LOC133790259 [Humulus lupulus]XP_062083832.1 uncharacterized protein LOC133790259 [Humulus lupulus]XP_062083833.1 uncharacterized protein LOC133790259 [Humulus lupulus]